MHSHLCRPKESQWGNPTTNSIYQRTSIIKHLWDITVTLKHKLRDEILKIAVRHLRVSQWDFLFFCVVVCERRNTLRKKSISSYVLFFPVSNRIWVFFQRVCPCGGCCGEFCAFMQKFCWCSCQMFQAKAISFLHQPSSKVCTQILGISSYIPLSM